jgi:hypothetical protein
LADSDGNISTAAPPIGFQWAVSIVVLILSITLLFFRLGHYALWDDESYTALIGQGVWRTGDTSAVIGHNIVAYRNGALLTNLKERYLPPLSYFVDAPFSEFGGNGSLLPRIPFALCGVATISLILWWLHRDGAPWNVWILMSLALLCNVSLFLYFRQARYYGLATFLTVLIAYHWTHWDDREWRFVILIASGCALLATNYLNYAALFAALAIDYFLFARRGATPTREQLLWLIGFQILCAALVVPVWNPLTKHPGAEIQNTMANRLDMIYRFFRDMNGGEFGVGIFWLICPLLYFRRPNPWFLRAPLALAVFVVVTAIFSPFGDMSKFSYSDIRYTSASIPLCLAIGVLVLAQFRGRAAIFGLLLACIAFGTNLLNGGPLLWRGAHSTIWQFVNELADPPPDPYRAASDWINAHVTEGKSIFVLPPFAMYPLMYHAPQAVYAFQLTDPANPQFRNLPPIDFQGHGVPDFVVTFGPQAVHYFLTSVPLGPSVQYKLIAALPVYGQAMYRPELRWRSFRAHPCDLARGEGIYIFQLAAN